MKIQAEENLKLRKYLLHELSEAEITQVSARLFLEREYSERLQAVEEDLIDEYVYEELSDDERKRFETYFLSEPQRYEELKIAEALKKYVASEPELAPLPERAEELEIISPPPPASFWTSLWALPQVFRLLLAVAVLIIVASGFWLILNTVRRQDQSQPVKVQLPTTPGGEVSPERQGGNKNAQGMQDQQAARNNPQPPVNVDKEVATGNVRQSNREAVKQPARPRTVITALLIPVGPTRDGGAVKKVVLPENASVVNFKLALITEDGNRNYQATLQTDDGRNIRTWTGLTSTRSNSAEVVSIRAPVNLFDQQSYNIMLKAVDASGIIRDINKYSFEVVKQPLRADRVR